MNEAFDSLFQQMVAQQGCDLFLQVGAPPFLRAQGALMPCGQTPITQEALLAWADALMGPERRQLFQAQRELNFAFERPGLGRFRANVLWQRGELALVIRRIQDRVPDLAELHLPVEVLTRLAQERQGLVLVTGPAGSGKSTTVAALLEQINQSQARHIVTLEDPIEFLFGERRSVITQREIGVDTRSFSDGLKQTLRQSPDVLFVSDLRDPESMEAALLAAESGQLVLSCVHATSAITTIGRLLAFFPPHQQEAARFRLALVLKGIVSLRLLPSCRNGVAQVPACEVLVMTPTIRQLIVEGRLEQIPTLLADGGIHGMQTMTQALYHLVQRGEVALPEALAVADSPEELQLALHEIRATKDVRRT